MTLASPRLLGGVDDPDTWPGIVERFQRRYAAAGTSVAGVDVLLARWASETGRAP